MGTGTYEYASRWRTQYGKREYEVSGFGEGNTSIERIASASVLVNEKKMSDNLLRNEIVTSPPPFSSAVLSEHYWGKLLSEEVLHKLIDDFGHGQQTNVQGSRIESNDIRRGGGSWRPVHDLREGIKVGFLSQPGKTARQGSD